MADRRLGKPSNGQAQGDNFMSPENSLNASQMYFNMQNTSMMDQQ